MTDEPQKTISRTAILFWTALLTAHATVAIAWWSLMPGGFPMSSYRFGANRAAPLIILLLAIAARFLIGKQYRGTLPILLFLATMWMGIGLGLKAIFPVTFEWFGFGPMIIGIALVAIARITVRHPLDGWVRIATAVGICFGVWLVMTQKALPPATKPLGGNFVFPELAPTLSGSIALSPQVRLDVSQATVQILSAGQQLAIEPLLTFDSRSPDRCWTLFASPALRMGPVRIVRGAEHTAGEKNLKAFYVSDYRQTLSLNLPDSQTVEMTSDAQLDKEIDSHLNTFTAMTLTSVRNPKVSFSPCNDVKIDITAGEYPFGKPHRFAYLGGDGIFRVVQATSAEKGPFHELASGKLAATDGLTMTFYDGDQAIYSVELQDWAAQVSTQPSPTAGWGVPENSIEFSRASDSPKSAVSIFVTLANTSVGRGFDSVGHAPGVYRNRMKVIDLVDPSGK